MAVGGFRPPPPPGLIGLYSVAGAGAIGQYPIFVLRIFVLDVIT